MAGQARLHVLVGVPIAVIDDDGVSGGEVDAKATSARGEQEAEQVWVAVELLHGLLAVLPLDAAVQAHAAMPLLLQVSIQQVQHLGHLQAHSMSESRHAHILHFLESADGEKCDIASCA